MQNFRDLRVWQASRELTAEVYRMSAKFPGAEKFGLTSQLRRATVSIAANIAEGCGRDTQPELSRFLAIATGSAAETEAERQLACDLGFISATDHAALAGRLASLRRMLNALMSRVRSANDRRTNNQQPTTNNQ
ncbi:MAG: four helix bundle protein [Terriglobales bacterium]